jgi:hypothetical protein
VEEAPEASATEQSSSSGGSGSSSSSRKKLMKRARYAECVSGVEAYDEMASFLSEVRQKLSIEIDTSLKCFTCYRDNLNATVGTSVLRIRCTANNRSTASL